MEKKHELPEFQVILQNQANAKFFVASWGRPFTANFANMQIAERDGRTAVSYEDGQDIGTDSVW